MYYKGDKPTVGFSEAINDLMLSISSGELKVEYIEFRWNGALISKCKAIIEYNKRYAKVTNDARALEPVFSYIDLSVIDVVTYKVMI